MNMWRAVPGHRAAGGRRGRLVAVVVGLALACTGVVAGRGAGPAAAADGVLLPPVPGRVLRTYAAEYMNDARRWTREEAVADALAFDLIIAKARSYPDHLAAMQAANPGLQVIGYMNASAVASPTRYPEDWYLRDAAGNKVVSARWGNHLMFPGNPDWVADRVATCQSLLAATGYDGCFLDIVGYGPVKPPYQLTGGVAALDPRTGEPYAMDAWLRDTVALANAVRAAIAPKAVIGNNIGQGPDYFFPPAPSSAMLDGVDGAHSEGFLRVGRDPLATIPDAAAWRTYLDMMLDATGRGQPLLLMTKAWNDGTAEQKAAVHEWSLATFLLGADGRHVWRYTGDEAADQTAVDPWAAIPIGTPLRAAATRRDGALFVRHYTGGEAWVNPTNRSYRVRLDQPRRGLDGTLLTGSVVLAPQSGRVLLLP